MSLSKEDEQSIYLKMLGAELDAGIKIARDQIHTTTGILTCRNGQDNKACFLRTTTGEDQLSGDTAVGVDFSKRSWDWIETKRPDLAAAPLVNANVRCDYIGKKSPPFSVEDVNCVIDRPLPPNETLIQAQPAHALLAALTERLSSVQQVQLESRQSIIMPVAGSLQCRVIESSKRSQCLVSSILAGNTADSLQELSQEVSRYIYNALSRLATTSDPSKELHATVLCDSSAHCQMTIK